MHTKQTKEPCSNMTYGEEEAQTKRKEVLRKQQELEYQKRMELYYKYSK